MFFLQRLSGYYHHWRSVTKSCSSAVGDDAFSTRLRWSASRGEGAAKLHGTRVLLSSPPVLENCPDMAELDYVPEAGGFRIRDRLGGWRDMEGHETKAADAFLRKVVPHA